MAAGLQIVSRFGTAIASAATIIIPADGDFFTVSGTTTITALTTSTVGAQPRAIGSVFRLRFTGAAPLTHNGASLILADAASYTPQVGEVLTFEVVATNQVREHGARYRAPYFPQVSKTGAYTLIDSDYEVLASNAAFTVTLPSATARAGKRFRITKTDSTAANIITIGGTVDGIASRKLGVQYATIEVESDGTNWRIIQHETPGVLAVTYAATVTPDMSYFERRGGAQATTLTGAVTIGIPASPTDGGRLELVLTQDATGTRTVTWNAIFNFNVTYPSPTVSTAINKRDRIFFEYNLAAVKWDCVGYSIGN